MQYRRLGRTDLMVSAICLGTMTWGNQNTPAEGHAQMDMALDHGVTFWDTAEMYAVPPSERTHGATERVIGDWFGSRPGKRHKVILATKVNGRTANPWVRGGQHRLDRANIVQALDESLMRLRTDHVDLYQVHWPDRPTPRFGALGWAEPAPPDCVPIEETLSALADLVHAGKVRHIGISNETAWGTMAYVAAAERSGLPQIVSIQNAYSLLNRLFEVDLAEVCLNSGVSLLPYSPIAGGHLTGKYLGGVVPPGTRRAVDPRPSRYATPGADPAIEAYVGLAREAGMTPAQLAVAFTLSRPFVASTIIGATNLDQLAEDLRACEIALSPDLLDRIDAIHKAAPNPCP